MDKGGFIHLILFVAIIGLATYQAIFPIPAYLAFIRWLGLSGLLFLCVSLILGPLAVIMPQMFAQLIAQRRAIGLASFVFVFMHFALSFWFQSNLNFGLLVSGIDGSIRIVAIVIFGILAATSFDWAVKNIKDWKNIQRLAYILFVFSFAHFLFRANGLFLDIGHTVFVNLNEIAIVALGAITAVLQVAGFLIVRGRQAAAKANQVNYAKQGE